MQGVSTSLDTNGLGDAPSAPPRLRVSKGDASLHWHDIAKPSALGRAGREQVFEHAQ